MAASLVWVIAGCGGAAADPAPGAARPADGARAAPGSQDGQAAAASDAAAAPGDRGGSAAGGDGPGGDGGVPVADGGGALALDGGRPGTVTVDDPQQPRSWPASHGQALIALWAHDALAALAITIDDNTAPDHSWWLQQGQTFGLRFTWFIITDKVGTSYGGSWAGFAGLVAQGHDVQSHTVSHLADAAAGTLTVAQEYGDSQQAIEANLPGVRALTLAYPGGTNSHLNDDALAAKYYIGARGVVGKDNPVDAIDYMRTNSISGKFILQTDHWAGIPNLIAFNPAHPKSFRAFHCIHYHQVGDKAAATAGLSYLQAHAADLWVGLFREVMQYGQQREAATLSVPYVAADRIVLQLGDTLDDGHFDFPLTIKVGLASHWTAAQATQGGAPAPLRIVQHGGAPFALVQAVPDRGPVELLRR